MTQEKQDTDLASELAKIYADLTKSNEPLGSEFKRAMNDNLEKLYEEC